MPGTDPHVMIHNGDAPASAATPRRRPASPAAMADRYLSVSDVDSASTRPRSPPAAKSLVGADGLRLGRPRGDDRSIRPAACSALWRGNQWRSDPRPRTTPPGGWIWNELATQDEKTALAFYEKVVRLFARRDADARRHVHYVLQARRQGPRAACTRRWTRQMPTQWTPLRLRRRRADKTTEQAQASGATRRRAADATFPASAGWRCSSIRRARSIAILKPDPNMG